MSLRVLIKDYEDTLMEKNICNMLDFDNLEFLVTLTCCYVDGSPLCSYLLTSMRKWLFHQNEELR